MLILKASGGSPLPPPCALSPPKCSDVFRGFGTSWLHFRCCGRRCLAPWASSIYKYPPPSPWGEHSVSNSLAQ
eukprot:1950688-Karenia_brevis.AAC.1